MIIGTAKRNKEWAKPLPTRHYSSCQEKAVSKAVGGKVQKNSGATTFDKGDVIVSGKNGYVCKSLKQLRALKTKIEELLNEKRNDNDFY